MIQVTHITQGMAKDWMVQVLIASREGPFISRSPEEPNGKLQVLESDTRLEIDGSDRTGKPMLALRKPSFRMKAKDFICNIAQD